MGKTGKSLEDEFIYKRDRELIEARLEREKRQQRSSDLDSHKHHCAHCGDNMEKREFGSAEVAVCSNCGSIHLTLSDLDKFTSEEDMRKLFYEIQREQKQVKVA